jgi:hypothetical protein
LKYAENDWGPKPFRFNNFWLEHKSFVKVVEDCWRGQEVEGWMAHVLKEKLRGLKICLKEWHKVEFGSVDTRLEKIVEDIVTLDVAGETTGLDYHEVALRKELFKDFWNLQKCKDASIFQRARSNWLRFGDANSKFFHGCIVARSRWNSISALKVGNIWLEKPSQIREAVHDFFENHFAAPSSIRLKLDGVSFPTLSVDDNIALTAPFSLEEIHLVVKESDGSKSLGPNDFNFAFLKRCWDILKGEIRIMFDQFHGIGSLPKCLLSYFVTLIPKVNSPFGLGDFRPISLFECLYKLIAKVLAVRLGKVMNLLIASNQSAFIKGRNLVDGVLVVNELVDLAKHQRKDCMIFKVDFEKAYDSVDWGFLEYMLRRFGFCDVWIGWMRACVFGGSLSVLVNGSPTGEINIQRGLKQGDPLAPFLFLLVAEGFGGAMRRAVEISLFKGFSIRANGPSVSHLQYADDTLCIGDASVDNLWSLKAILRGFELASGLKVNFWKSCLIGVNVSNEFMESACNFLNCIRGVVPFNYLGLPVGANPRRMSTWLPMVEKIRSKLFSWKNKHISFGGRLVLINSVLNSIPIFYLSFFKLPVQVKKMVVRIQREFLWGGVSGGKKISWLKWKVVCLDKKKGGLGVRDLNLVNKSHLLKWRWRLLNSGDVGVWKDVLVAKYGEFILSNVNLSSVTSPYFASLWWKDVRDLEKCIDVSKGLEELIVRKVGNGLSTRFWRDVWLGDSALCVKFPRLFSLSSQIDARIGDLFLLEGESRSWSFIWRRSLFLWEEDLVSQLLVLLDSVLLSFEEDRWCWKLNPVDGFSVKSAFEFLGELEIDINSSAFELEIFEKIWESSAPSKVIVLSWRLLYDRLPTKDNLRLRGVVHNPMDGNCCWCNLRPETSNHLFLHCSVAHRVWCEIFKWLGVVVVMPANSFHLFDCFSEAGVNKKSRKGLRLVWHTAIWELWRARNNLIFNNIREEPMDIVEGIKVLSWRWSVDQLNIPPCLFYEWVWDPGDCFLR